MDEREELIELYETPDVFVNGLANVEDIGGGCVRFTFFKVQEIGGKPAHLVAERLVMPLTAVPEALHTTAVKTGSCACHNVKAMARN